jgi:hypothetical protein
VGQVTVQLTPLFELSLLTVAEICAVAPGCTAAGVTPIATSSVCCMTLLPPHPERTIAANPGSDTANHFKLFISSLPFGL